MKSATEVLIHRAAAVIKSAQNACVAYSQTGHGEDLQKLMKTWPDFAAVVNSPRSAVADRFKLTPDETSLAMQLATSGRGPAEPAAVRGLTFDFSGLITAELHMGFLSVEETPEQLARLIEVPKNRKKRRKMEADLREAEGFSVVRSRISRSPLVLKPINRTAWKVAPVEKTKDKENEDGRSTQDQETETV